MEANPLTSRKEIERQAKESERRAKIEELMDLEPDDTSLSGAHWLPDTGREMRRQIAFTARLRAAGLGWGDVADVLDYETPVALREAVVEGHRNEWGEEIKRANVDVQNKLLPRKTLQALLMPINDFIDGNYGADEKYDAGRLAIQAANAASTLIRTTEKMGISEEVFDEDDQAAVDDAKKFLKGLQGGG